MNLKIKQLIIASTATLKFALKKMDEVGHKLLMIADDDTVLLGLITIGDIQRAIISNAPLETAALNYSRKEIIIAKSTDDILDIKKPMLNYRLAYMPIVDEENKIVNVVFWEDIIDGSVEAYQSLNLPVVIMAGGLGTRLKPLTNILPKPLLPYGDSTILENIIHRFKKYNCTQFDISVNYKSDLIQFYFDSLQDKDYVVNFFTESSPLGTAGSLHLLEDKLNSTFFVSNCDILIDDDYGSIYQYHKENENELTIVASVKTYHIPYGTIESGKKGELVALTEKPQLDYLINCGMYILEPHLLKEIPHNIFFHITDLIEKIKSRSGKVGVFPISEKSWIDIGEWQSYSKILLSNSK